MTLSTFAIAPKKKKKKNALKWYLVLGQCDVKKGLPRSHIENQWGNAHTDTHEHPIPKNHRN